MPVLEAPPSLPTKNIGKVSDADCWSARTDHFKGETLKCRCGKDAVGGSPIEWKQSIVGKSFGLFRFDCSDCELASRAAISTSLMFPTWKIIIEQAPGLYWIRHLNEQEQQDRLNGLG